MSHSNPSREFSNPATNLELGSSELFYSSYPLLLRTQQVKREVFDKYPGSGLDGGENDPEIYPAGLDGLENDPEVYPVYHAGEHSGGLCEVCGFSKYDCAC